MNSTVIMCLHSEIFIDVDCYFDSSDPHHASFYFRLLRSNDRILVDEHIGYFGLPSAHLQLQD